MSHMTVTQIKWPCCTGTASIRGEGYRPMTRLSCTEAVLSQTSIYIE